MKTDIHQHLWTEPLVQALAQRREFPFVRDEHGLTVLYLAGERPYVIDLASEAPARRAELVSSDGLDRALVCLSSPLGIESLPRAQALGLLDAYHEGALALGEPFGVWGALALDRPDPDDVDRALDRGCVGISLPAGALAGVDRLARLRPLLARLERRGAPLFVHPGPGYRARIGRHARRRRALARRSRSGGRRSRTTSPTCTRPCLRSSPPDGPSTPSCGSSSRCSRASRRCIAERLAARGGPSASSRDPTARTTRSSSTTPPPTGPLAIGALADAIGGPGQLLYGSDRPVVEPTLLHEPGGARLGAARRRHRARLRLGAARRWRIHGARARVSGSRARIRGPGSHIPGPGTGARRGRCRRSRAKPPKRPGRAGGGSPMRTPLASVPRPRDRDLTAPELQAFVAELADRPELWIGPRPPRPHPARLRGTALRRAPDRVADLLDG